MRLSKQEIIRLAIWGAVIILFLVVTVMTFLQHQQINQLKQNDVAITQAVNAQGTALTGIINFLNEAVGQ